MSKCVLVTGAAGFIGSHAAEALLRRGDDVVGLDNLDPYYAPERKQANLASVQATATRSPGRFTFHQGDIRDRGVLAAVHEQGGFDALVHLAALAGVRASIEAPALYYDVNLGGTLQLLEAARDAGTPHVVFASTSSVYGASAPLPFVESDAADRPLAPYPASKRAAEMLGYTHHHLHGTSFTALRFFTVYGPRSRPDMMAFKLLDSMYQGGEVPLYEGGNLHRDWTFIDDIVTGVLAAVDRPLGYEVINLGRGEPVLLSDFVARMRQVTGRQGALVSETKPAADVAYTFADISKARRLLGYDPKVSVQEGIEATVRWYRQALLAS